jgi:hypothetical protein
VPAFGTEQVRVKEMFGMSEWKEQLARTRCRWNQEIILDLKGIICGVVD